MSHSPVALLGIAMALGGGVWYALARQNVANRAKEAKDRAAALAAATATETPAASKA